MYYLLVKTINETGLKYLCKCRDNKDPIAYKGSGVLWRKILSENPDYTITTEIIGHYNTNADLKEAGLRYSEMYNVVRSNEWANIIPEIGDGGPTVSGKKRIHSLIEQREKLVDPALPLEEGWKWGGLPKGPRDPSITKKIVKAQTGVQRSEEIRNKFKESWQSGNRKPIPKIECEKCGRSIVAPNWKRHYNVCHSHNI